MRDMNMDIDIDEEHKYPNKRFCIRTSIEPPKVRKPRGICVATPFRLPKNWNVLKSMFNSPHVIKIQSLYRGYRLRQRLAEWRATKQLYPESITKHHLWSRVFSSS